LDADGGPAAPIAATAAARRIGIGAALLVAAFAAIYGAAFAAALPASALERAAGAGPAFRALQAALGGSPAMSRAVAVACLVVAVLATARFAARAAHDSPVGGFFALGWVLFPSAVAICALATPTAPALALASLALAGLWPAEPGWSRGNGLGALALTVAALMSNPAAWLVMALVLALMLVRPSLWTLLAPALGAALAMAATVPPARPPSDWIQSGADPVIFGALLPYAMIWVGAALGAVASRSSAVIARLGWRTVWVCRAAPVLYAALLLARGLPSAEPGPALLLRGAELLPLGLLGSLPLVVWVRLAMPRVRALGAWLAFPVIMYACFWVILGPVTAERFPYRLLHLAAAPPSAGEN
jgi:hypothetical protein